MFTGKRNNLRTIVVTLLVNVFFFLAAREVKAVDKIIEEYDVLVKENVNPYIYVYDEKASQFLPYIKKLHKKTKTISFVFNQSELKNTFLKFVHNSDVSIFLNNSIIEYVEKENVLFLDIDSLCATIQDEHINLTFHSIELPIEVEKVDLYVRKLNTKIQKGEHYPVFTRSANSNNFVIIITILLLLAYVYAKYSYTKLFNWYFDFTKILINAKVEENIVVSVFGREALMLLSLNACVLSFVFINLLSEKQFLELNISGGYLALFFIVLLISALIFVVKYLLLKLVCNYLGESMLAKLHFFEFHRLLTLILLLSLPLSLYLKFSDHTVYWMTNVVIALFLTSLIRIIFVINKATTFRNLYLFSYICTTEILPVIFTFKFVSGLV